MGQHCGALLRPARVESASAGECGLVVLYFRCATARARPGWDERKLSEMLVLRERLCGNKTSPTLSGEKLKNNHAQSAKSQNIFLSKGL